ncbi:hypothetical protein Rleg4DRAFT_7038 [Rhizobium leguminosarum bv. trifolii WSM2297]|uniref:DUF4363 family protein n=1 Tax=Rhizobium leguminosarum bv. trifolii WSM2297 TaxID=754762 RepID=J0WBV2_RHILT|nr:hypothetical protein [Rhizobium leguminosarum]EJC83241.1 hypothetical protein Rleg4DRAFT_4984 [Rhizobium leguminosarum bv. trifolii WSM2297]EJC85166.1 hypothetical protein Rleg4DRAFT_7038 [Rhizobium leguminosarum bv. trifolii WSM2297]
MTKSFPARTSSTHDRRAPTSRNVALPGDTAHAGQGHVRIFPARTVKRSPRWSNRALSAVLLLSLASCSNEDEQSHKQLQEILVWSASAEMILEARLGGRVPEGFTDLAVQRCHREILHLSSQLPQTSRYDQARAAVVRLNGLIATAHDEIGHGRFEEGHQNLVELHRYEAEQLMLSGAGG